VGYIWQEQDIEHMKWICSTPEIGSSIPAWTKIHTFYELKTSNIILSLAFFLKNQEKIYIISKIYVMKKFKAVKTG